MKRVVLFDPVLKDEYVKLFGACRVHPERIALVDNIVRRIEKERVRYGIIAQQIGCPWFLVGLIHNMECGLDFHKHLHNGDPLHSRTTHVPAGRPAFGSPPFTFEQSALDALRVLRFDSWHDWSIAGILWRLETYNGLGYRQYHPEVKSPYLWSMTSVYTKGKYVADGRYDSEAVSRQVGVAAILKRGVELGVFKV